MWPVRGPCACACCGLALTVDDRGGAGRAAGQERFGSLTRVYYQGASACVIVFDLTSRRTFAAVSKWKADLDSKVALADGRPLPCLLLANKCDLKQQRAVTAEEVERLAKEQGFIAWCAPLLSLQRPPPPQPHVGRGPRPDPGGGGGGGGCRYETSAKDNTNVDKAMMKLVETILADDAASQPPPGPSAGAVQLGAGPAAGTGASGGSDTFSCGGCMK
jgi:GTPase SAR1 family protein